MRKKQSTCILRCLWALSAIIGSLTATALPVKAFSVTLPDPSTLHAAWYMVWPVVIGGFLLMAIGLCCLDYTRKKNKNPTVGALCLVLFLGGLALASAPVSLGWYNRQKQKKLANTYRTYAAAMEQADVEQAYRRAAAYNLLTAAVPADDADTVLPSINQVVAVLELPTIGQTLPVYFMTGPEALGNGVGLPQGSAIPLGIRGTHTVLVGRSGFLEAELFSDLHAMRVGNPVYIHILGRTMTYQVDWAQAVSPAKTGEEAVFPMLAGEDQITLVTAYADNAYFLVHGVRIPAVSP